MESSIAEFLERQLACELLPTVITEVRILCGVTVESKVSEVKERCSCGCSKQVGRQGMYVYMPAEAI